MFCKARGCFQNNGSGHWRALCEGAHNIRAATIASQLGRDDVAAAMAAAGLLDGTRARAALSPRDRLIEERAQVFKADVARATAAAWKASEDGMPLAAALAANGLRLAWGDKKNVPVVVDGAGTAHGLGQMLRMAAREDGTKAPKPEAIAVRLDGMAVPSVADVRQEIQAEGNKPAEPMIDAGIPIPTAPIAAQAIPVAVNDQAIPAAETVAKIETVAPSQDATGGKKTVAASSKGIGFTPSAESTRPTGAALKDVGDGPGDPPGPGATIKQQQDYRAKLAEYQERRGKAWARWVASQQTRPRAEAPINKGPVGEQDNAAIRKQAEASAEKIRGALSLTVSSIFRVSETSRNVANGHAIARGNTGDEGPRAASRELPRSDGRTEPRRAADTAPRDGGLPRVGADRGASVADGGARIARPRIVSLAENARIRTGLAACDLSGLRAAREALQPVAQVVVLQDRREAAAARVMEDGARIAGILATHPHPNPDDLDLEARERKEERKARDEHTASKAADAAASKTAATAAFQDRGPLTWLRNVIFGSPTIQQKQALDAADYAERNRNTRPDDSALKDARDRGRLLAMSARDRVAAWEVKPDVVIALEHARLNELVDQAANAGDQTILRALNSGNPEAARLIIQLREESDHRAQEELERRQGIQRPNNPSAPRDGGPRTPGMK